MENSCFAPFRPLVFSIKKLSFADNVKPRKEVGACSIHFQEIITCNVWCFLMFFFKRKTRKRVTLLFPMNLLMQRKYKSKLTKEIWKKNQSTGFFAKYRRRKNKSFWIARPCSVWAWYWSRWLNFLFKSSICWRTALSVILFSFEVDIPLFFLGIEPSHSGKKINPLNSAFRLL